MKKNLIALAVSAAMVVPAIASADIKAYGAAQVEIASVDNGTDSAIGMADNGRGRVGIKASEDLGGGWTGLAKFEFKADTTDNNTDDTACTAAGAATCSTKAKASLTARESMVGLKKKGVGTFELGRLKQAYKYSGGVKYDPFVATLLEARGNGGMSGKTGKGKDMGHSSFHSNAIGYKGKLGPVKVGLTYGPTEDDGSMTLSGMYATKAFEVFVAIADDGDRSGADEFSATKFGGAWKFGNHKITAQIESTSQTVATVESDPSYTFFGYQGKWGKNTFAVQLGGMDADTASGAGDKGYLGIGIIHKMSKKTRVFAGLAQTATSTGATADVDSSVVSVGVRKDFK